MSETLNYTINNNRFMAYITDELLKESIKVNKAI